MRARLLIATTTFLCGAAMPALGQRMSGAAGKVLDDISEKPIAGAEVSIPGLGLKATSDSAGAFRLGGVPAGKQIVWVRKIGFTPLSAVLTFVAGETLDNEFMLVPSTTRLPEVAVKAPKPVAPKLQEFEERRKMGFGHFITEEQLQRQEGRRLSEVFATIPGPMIIRGTTNAAWIAGGRLPIRGTTPSDFDRRKGARPACYAAVILDGIFVYSGRNGEPLWDINSIQPSDIAGIEFYASETTIPAKYNGPRQSCGLVVIWTKV